MAEILKKRDLVVSIWPIAKYQFCKRSLERHILHQFPPKL